MKKNNIRKLVSGLLICLPLAFNPFIIKSLLSTYTGDELSSFNKLFVYAVQVFSVFCGILIIKQKEFYLKKMTFWFLLFTPILFTMASMILMHVPNRRIFDSVYGELLNVLILFLLILFIPRVGMCLSFIVLAITNFVSFFYAYVHSRPISTIDFTVIVETNWDESWEYLTSYIFSFPFLLYWLLCGFAMWAIIMNIKKIEIKVIRLTLLPMLLIAVLAFSSKDTAEKIYKNNIFYSLNKARLAYTESIKNLNAVRDSDIGFVSISRSVQGPEVHLVILDESASRRHMSLYGYHRDTTPELDKMADDLLIFNDVISPNSHTFPVLKKAVTFLNTEDTTSAWEKGTLFQHLQKAGYHCYWLSAQGGQGRHNTFTLALSNFCNETYFIRDGHSTGDSGYDDDLNGWLEKILDDEHQKKFIFVHKMGKHVKYKLRFPQTSAVYSGNIQGKTSSQSEIINDYDNAVLYDSANIAEMIKYVKNLNVYSTVLYLSDHGEEVCENGDYFGHDQSRSRYMHEIPFVLWMSDSYKKNNKQKVSNIRQYLYRRYMTDDLLHSILDMLNIQAKHLELGRSIFSSNFIPRSRIIGNNKDHNYDTIFGRSEISLSQMQEALASRQAHFKSRVWAHKVNSIEKLQQAANLYSGVELDVVYFPEKNVFDIHHPPEKSVGLTLDKYWGSNNYNDSLYYWIDFKNLTQDNSESALFRLSRLAEKFGISAEKILVESKNALALKKFRDKGFITSYYLPSGTLKELAGKQELNIAITGLPQAQKIQTLFQDSGVDGISTNAQFYYLLDILFPKVEQVFLRDTTLEYYDEHDSEIIENTLIQNDRIKVLLTCLKSEHN